MEEEFTHGNIMEGLQSIGLCRNEAIVYVALLRNGKASALDIARRTRLHRPNIYDALRKLIEKGFVNQTSIDGKRYFKAIGPEKIKQYIDQKKQEMELVLPQLTHFSEEIPESEEISLVHGTFAIRMALADSLKLNSTINAIGAGKQSVEAFGQGFLREFHKRRIKKKVIMRHITNFDNRARAKYLSKLKYTPVKELPKKYDTNVATMVFGDTVMMFIFANPPSAIIIKNQKIADTYNNYFELEWKAAKPLGKTKN